MQGSKGREEKSLEERRKSKEHHNSFDVTILKTEDTPKRVYNKIVLENAE